MRPAEYVRTYFVVGLLFSATTVSAHPMAPALLDVREHGNGIVAVAWKTPRLLPSGMPLEPVLPASCATIGERGAETTADAVVERWQVDCGKAPLTGMTLAATGLRENAATAIVRIELADGRSIRALLTERAPSFVVPARQSRRSVLAAYLRLGIEHLAFGLDHLLFVLGLLLLVERRSALLAAITAFTAGHTVTLSLATLGVVSFPQRVAEAAIAASILVLAVELEKRCSGSPSRWVRRPWTMALVFGLLHGLGFAGALAEIGLPSGEIPLALLGFNVGIELAQVGFVVFAIALGSAARSLLALAPVLRIRAPAYAIGTLAAYWCFDRTGAIFGF